MYFFYQQLLVFLAYHCKIVLSIVRHQVLQTPDFLFLLPLYFIDFLLRIRVDAHPVPQLSFHSLNFVFVLFFLLLEISLSRCHFLFESLISSGLLLDYGQFAPLLRVHTFLLPNLNFLEHSFLISSAFLIFEPPLFKSKLHLLAIGPEFEELLVPLDRVFFKLQILLVKQFAFDFEILSLPQAQPGFIELVS